MGNYSIRVHTPVCPLCNGAMDLLYGLNYQCNDCRNIFQVLGEGLTEKDIVVGLLGKGESEVEDE